MVLILGPHWISFHIPLVLNLVGKPRRGLRRLKSYIVKFGPELKRLMGVTRSMPTRVGTVFNSSPGISFGFIEERRDFQARENPNYFLGRMDHSRF